MSIIVTSESKIAKFAYRKMCFMSSVLLLLGGNLGDVQRSFETAIVLISKQCGVLEKVSSIYKSSPWGYESDNLYLNQALKITTNLSPIDLLDATQALEIELGRLNKTSTDYSDRPIDIDILDFDGAILESKRLVLPHPRLHLRKFAIHPLMEIEPLYQHPKFEKSISQLLEVCSDDSVIEKMDYSSTKTIPFK